MSKDAIQFLILCTFGVGFVLGFGYMLKAIDEWLQNRRQWPDHRNVYTLCLECGNMTETTALGKCASCGERKI
jgi:hypothetical protein